MRFRTVGPLVAVLLASCASVPRHRGNDDVNAMLRERHQLSLPVTPEDRERAVAQAGRRLERPLRVDDAVAIALARSPEVARSLAELGLVYADLLEASRLSNPTLSVSALDSDEPGARTQIGLSIVQSFTDVLLFRSRLGLTRGEFKSAQEEAVRGLQDAIAEVVEDYFTLVGEQQVAEMRRIVATAGRNAATLAERFHAAGNMPALERALQQADAVDAELGADEASVDAVEAHHALAARLGLSTDEAYTVVDTLPLPVKTEDALEDLLPIAYRSRVDLAAARRRAELLARSLGVTRAFRWLGEFEVGFERERETDGAVLRGPSVSLQLPIFHQNQAAVARAEAQVDLAIAEATALERGIGHEVKAAHAKVAAAHRRVERLQSELVPLREEIVARTQEEFNFMLTGAFELIEARQEEFDAYEDYLDALREYWLARNELSRAIGRGLPSDATISAGGGAAAVKLPDAPATMDHEGHDMSSMPGAAADPHAGHGSQPQAKPDPHAGHAMPSMDDPHAGHGAPASNAEEAHERQEPNEGKSDVHRGHEMPAAPKPDEVSTEPANDPHAAHRRPTPKPADPPAEEQDAADPDGPHEEHAP